MENIDIIDPNFSLSNNIDLGNDNMLSDYNEHLWLWIGVFVFVVFSGLILYRFYQSKKEDNENQLDCLGGFCNMNDKA